MQTEAHWSSTAPTQLCLSNSEIHIWRSNINISKSLANEMLPILSSDEKERANSFKFDEHRLKFIAARSTLRKILSCYLEIDPASIKFIENEYGKPKIDKNTKGIFFNISHAHNLAAYAISKEANIGIDIEFINAKVDFNGISTRFFSDKESLYIQSLPVAEKATAFYKIWTAKEAFIKAIGQGLSFPLKEFEISLANNTVVLESIYGDPCKAKEWTLLTYRVPAEYESCIAIQSITKPRLNSWEIAFNHE
jgi:4'-phosphopantetheinyl transferase